MVAPNTDQLCCYKANSNAVADVATPGSEFTRSDSANCKATKDVLLKCGGLTTGTDIHAKVVMKLIINPNVFSITDSFALGGI